ncbi:hypothetical protein SO802_009334 [Lithocarpus litseifolius]|uniref:Golgi SNAP receptor complex member 1 n=1 Tax=Lithocarpus litseifolius TaxID=425828 RepID=A0AAW2DD91_9ROSI
MTDQNLELQESGWEELRREARKIEGDLDVKLSSYAKLGARFTQGGYVDTGSPSVGSSRSWKSMEMEIQSSLEKLLDINDSMSRCAASATPATSVTQKLARHRDILHEFTQEFRRIKGNINSMSEHAELLSSVRDDISEYKASGSMSPRMQLLRERAAIHGSIAHIDDVIGQAQTTRQVLGSQKAMFGDVQGKVKNLSDKFPIIRGLLGSIKRRKSRDTLILAAVIAAFNSGKHQNRFCLNEAREYFYCIANSRKKKQFISIPVKWNKPLEEWFKLNTDGASSGNPDVAGILYNRLSLCDLTDMIERKQKLHVLKIERKKKPRNSRFSSNYRIRIIIEAAYKGL